MPRIRAIRKAEDAEKIPLDQPVLIETAPVPEKIAKEDIVETKSETTPEVVKDEPVIEAKEEPEKQEPVKDDIPALRKRLEESERAVELQRQRAEQAERLAQSRAQEVTVSRSETQQAQLDAVVNALSAAQSDADNAQRDLEAAIANADAKSQAEAQRRISKAEALISRLEDGKTALESSREERRPETVETKAPPDQFESAISKLPEKAKSWLREHREYVQDPDKNIEIQYVHTKLAKKGLEPFSDAYYSQMETELGLRQQETRRQEPDDDDGDTIVSAPPTRDTVSLGNGRPSSDTRVELTPDMRAAAKASGVSDIVYAENLLKMRQLKKEGLYNDR